MLFQIRVMTKSKIFLESQLAAPDAVYDLLDL
jgi:hypothetical protein